ncbi:MAG: DUF3048 C-terminal domain-containing protein, partial [Patescibacteria group bacterium]
NFVKWAFEDGSPAQSFDASEISFEFWEDRIGSENYKVTWKYNASTNNYLRENGGEPHVDLASGEQISAGNVVILFMRERTSVDRNKHLLYTTIGEGQALVFQNGKVIEGEWNKDSRESRTRIFDENGSEVSFVRGPIWIEVLPLGNEVNY